MLPAKSLFASWRGGFFHPEGVPKTQNGLRVTFRRKREIKKIIKNAGDSERFLFLQNQVRLKRWKYATNPTRGGVIRPTVFLKVYTRVTMYISSISRTLSSWTVRRPKTSRRTSSGNCGGDRRGCPSPTTPGTTCCRLAKNECLNYLKHKGVEDRNKQKLGRSAALLRDFRLEPR